jgi:CubicO group peptidase (beta-lactamase class C family)
MKRDLSRRAALQAILAGSAALTAAPLFADEPKRPGTSPGRPTVTGKPNKALAPFDDLMLNFVHNHKVPGAALAVTRNAKLVYSRGFGWADIEEKRAVQPESLFRIASVSKPLTAVAVLQLIEKSKFGLNDRVFDHLDAKHWLPAKCDERLRAVTIRQLLHHTAGWDRDKSFDPIGRPRDVARVLNKPLPVGPADVVRYTLTLPLDFDPGTRFAYSNVGYLLLGRLIEHATGKHYEKYVKEHVLAPVGVNDMQLGRSWIGDLAANEVRYYDPKHREWPAVNGPKLEAKVPIVYGGENFEAFEAHGGWIASAVDLVRFASAFDKPAASKLLKPPSIAAMWARPDGPAGHEPDGKPKDAYYGCGWNVRPVGDHRRVNTWHDGLIAGTSTLLVRRHDGLNWAVLFNSDSGPDGKPLSSLIDPLVHQAADAVRNWPEPLRSF